MKPLTLIYTHNIRGSLDLLPKLHTFIQSLKPNNRGLLVDLGNAASLEQWPDRVTQGRSTLIVMDAMGYIVANVNGLLPPPIRAKFAEQITMKLVNSQDPYHHDDILFTCHESSEQAEIRIIVTPTHQTRYLNEQLKLQALETGQVGIVEIVDSKVTFDIHTMPANTRPNPTISGTVDFVKSEAHLLKKKTQPHR